MQNKYLKKLGFVIDYPYYISHPNEETYIITEKR